MLMLVTGGAASGKSAFAENLITKSGIKPRVYVACMAVRDEKDTLIVERHRMLRKDKDFTTIEAPIGLNASKFPKDGAVLIEDLSNLAANECFMAQQGFDGAKERILSGIMCAKDACALSVVVTCEIGADGVAYDAWTQRFIALLAQINMEVAALSDEVYEIVCGIPIQLKGKRV